jgi:hypothetical protein
VREAKAAVAERSFLLTATKPPPHVEPSACCRRLPAPGDDAVQYRFPLLERTISASSLSKTQERAASSTSRCPPNGSCAAPPMRRAAPAAAVAATAAFDNWTMIDGWQMRSQLSGPSRILLRWRRRSQELSG